MALDTSTVTYSLYIGYILKHIDVFFGVSLTSSVCLLNNSQGTNKVELAISYVSHLAK